MGYTVQTVANWQFTQVGGGRGTKDGEWLPVSQFPTTVHVELLQLGRIPDPVRKIPLNRLLKLIVAPVHRTQ
jgi:hypothetical protein